MNRGIRRTASVALAALTLGVIAQPASAGNLFEMLFGGGFERRAQAPLPPQTSSYADPLSTPGQRSEAEGFGHGSVYCVRTCDGRYFPMQNHAGASPAEICRSFCPAAKTMVFSGSKIDTAVAQNGARYADLDSAFAYRDKVVDHCTCNGKDGLGLARVEPKNDPTLRPGDIVATDKGLTTYTGSRKSAEFTPIGASSGEWARRLADVKVRPAPPAEKIVAVANDDTQPVRKTRAQASR